MIVTSEKGLDFYLEEIGKYEPLSGKYERELLLKYKKDRDMEAREKLIKHNLKFVVSTAKFYYGGVLSSEDLIQEGTFGLIEAVEKYDFNKYKGKLITYAVRKINGKMLVALDEELMIVRMPQNRVIAVKKIREIEEEIMADEEDLIYEPTERAIAEYNSNLEKGIKKGFGIRIEDVAMVLGLSADPIKILNFIPYDDSILPCEELIEKARNYYLNSVLDSLKYNKGVFVKLHFKIEDEKLIKKYGLDYLKEGVGQLELAGMVFGEESENKKKLFSMHVNKGLNQLRDRISKEKLLLLRENLAA